METFSSLLQRTQDLCVDDNTQTFNALSTSASFLTTELNNSIRDIFHLIKKYSLQPDAITDTTVATQIYYKNPLELSKIESVTVSNGTLVYPLCIVHSQADWDRLHVFPLLSGIPQAVFPRRDDYGIFPTPQSTGQVITVTGNYTPINITTPDYSGGTVTVTSASATLTGSGTTFTASMVGRWFCLTDSNGVPDGNWIKISGYTSATSLTLSHAYVGTTLSGKSFIIGQSPNCPEELQEFIPYRAAASYFQHRRRDPVQAQQLLNFYYTGDFNNTRRTGNIRGGVLGVLTDLQEKGRGNSSLVEMGGLPLTPQVLGGIWSTLITDTP